jgi:hypothetical protein
MSRNAANAQSTRSLSNPLNLGTFSSTSLRYLKGKLGPENKVIGRADTGTTSNGGFGGGTYNHWFQVTLDSPAWIIVTKGPPRPQYIQTSAYDLNKTPIEGQSIFDADSIASGLKENGEVYVPYLDTVMAAKSDLYNQFSRIRLDRGDERYYPFAKGSYLICISSTRNEPLDYEVGVVVEFPSTQVLFELEDSDGSLFVTEETQEFPVIGNPVAVNTTVPVSEYYVSPPLLQINPGVTLTISSNGILAVGQVIPASQYEDYGILTDIGNDDYFDTVHDHSLSEWTTSWQNEHQESDRFPSVFVELTNRP